MSKTELTNLAQLQDTYLEYLTHHVQPVLQEWVDSGYFTQLEADGEIRAYYKKTRPILQKIYSRYARYWDAYNNLKAATDRGFLTFLKKNENNMELKYALGDLDVEYYITRYSSLPSGSNERRQLRTLFEEKWYSLLLDNEYSYQLKKMDELCQNMVTERERVMALMKQKFALGTGGKLNRMHFLLRNYSDETVRAVFEYLDLATNSPLVREIVDYIGHAAPQKRKRFSATNGINPQFMASHSQKSDIVGVTEGADLNSLLPLEYCYLSDPSMQGVFLRRWSEKRLQTFDYISHRLTHLQKTPRTGNEIADPDHMGPFIVCLDTSASMMGYPELMSKSIILAMAQMTASQNRPFYLINFSETIKTISVTDINRDLYKVVDFLMESFHRGSDMNPAVEDALEKLSNEDFTEADLLFLSDFRLDEMTPEVYHDLMHQKKRGTRVYSVTFGKTEESDYLALSDRVWEAVER